VPDSVLRHSGAADRRTRILSTLRSAGFLTIAELTVELGVSHMTIRRDLRALEEAGYVRTVHGGVSISRTALTSGGFPDIANSDELIRLARAAVELVAETDTVAIDAGPAGFEVALALPQGFRGTVITHSMPVLQLLAERLTPPTIVALGGELHASRQAFVGPTAEVALARLRARTLFLSVAAVDMRGIYAFSANEAGVQRALIRAADNVVLLAEQDAFSQSAPVLIDSLTALTRVVTIKPPRPQVIRTLNEAGISISLIPTSPSGR
jgi:DeoR/GlpR family transcriptional regulator of sugar metabolism